MELLEKALENEQNESILQLSKSKIKADKDSIFKKYSISSSIQDKLENYRVVSDIEDIQHGYYVRWISKTNPNTLKHGGIVCTIDYEEERTQVRNNCNRFFTCNLKNNIIFQKITEQEGLLLEITALFEDK